MVWVLPTFSRPKQCADVLRRIKNSGCTSRGDWCKKCSGYLKKTGRDYHDIAIIYGGQWVGTKIPKNNKEDTQWVCAQGHKFDNDYNNIQQYNCFCRYCKKPFMGQMVTKLYLEGLTGLNFQTSRPKFLTYENGSPLELDGYNKEAAIAFEYNGIEHYEKSARQSQEAFEKLQKRDTWKYQKVMENNIKLLIIKEINGKFNEQHIKNSVLDFILKRLVLQSMIRATQVVAQQMELLLELSLIRLNKT